MIIINTNAHTHTYVLRARNTAALMHARTHILSRNIIFMYVFQKHIADVWTRYISYITFEPYYNNPTLFTTLSYTMTDNLRRSYPLQRSKCFINDITMIS